MMKHLNFDPGTFYLCYLIEHIGRQYKVRRKDIVNILGYNSLKHLYKLEDVYHCLPIEQVIEEIQEELHVDFMKLRVDEKGHYKAFNNVESCLYYVPKITEVANTNTYVINHLTKRWQDTDQVETLIKFYNARVHDRLENYNTDLFAESPEYLTECFVANDIL